MLPSVLAWFAQGIIVVIFLQAVYEKARASEKMVELFSALGLEPWGRYAVCGAELLAVILLITPFGAWYGALLSLFIIVPALLVHLFKVGIRVRNDRGLLFELGLAVFVLSIAIVLIRWQQGPFALPLQ